MHRVNRCREEIYDYFQKNEKCQAYFLDPVHDDDHAAYYNSAYLLQDTTESLWYHRQQGFSSSPFSAYLEFWGVMQAVIIQQDAISEMHQVIVGSPLDARASNLTAWLEIRELRNLCSGHPAKKNRPKNKPIARSFMGRRFGGYEQIAYELWEQGAGTSYPKVRLGALLDRYAQEAAQQLSIILNSMKARWP
jgi:hypothetical protein